MKSYISRKLPLTTRNTVRNPCCDVEVLDMAVSRSAAGGPGGMLSIVVSHGGLGICGRHTMTADAVVCIGLSMA